MSTIVLAYSGGLASSVAVHRLASESGVDVVTVTLDLGQGEDLNVLRARAIACGAARAHVIDAREQLVRECLFPSLARGAIGDAANVRFVELARPIIARNLLEIAAIEGAAVVAHGAHDAAIDNALHAIDAAASIRAPAREWDIDAGGMGEYARDHGLPIPRAIRGYRIEQNLWGRVVRIEHGAKLPSDAAAIGSSDSRDTAHVAITFERGVPVAINGVPMAPVELVESLDLIAGRHGIGRVERTVGVHAIVYDAPAAVVLHTARAAAGEGHSVVRLTALQGRLTVFAADTELVNHA